MSERPKKLSFSKRLYVASVGAFQLQRAFHMAAKGSFADALKVLRNSSSLKKIVDVRRSEASIEARSLETFLRGATGENICVASLLKDIRMTTSFNEDEKTLLYRYVLYNVLLFRRPGSDALNSAVTGLTFDRSNIRGTLLSRYGVDAR